MGKISNIPWKIHQLCDLTLSSQQSYEEIGIERLSDAPKATQLLQLWAQPWNQTCWSPNPFSFLIPQGKAESLF